MDHSSSLELSVDDIVKMRIVIAVIGGKGGIGKSFASQIMAALLRTMGPVRMVDTDFTNSSTLSVDPDAVMIDLWDTTARGALAVALRSLKDDGSKLVIDTGAQEDKLVAKYIGWLAREAAKAEAVLVPVLPITLSSHVQAQACSFARTAAELGLPVLFLRNLGQGRDESDYEHWMGTRARAAALELGVVEVDIPDLGARWSDEASGFGMSVDDAAQGRFHKAGEAAAAAREILHENARAWFNIYIDEFGEAFVAGLAQAVANRRKPAGRI